MNSSFLKAALFFSVLALCQVSQAQDSGITAEQFNNALMDQTSDASRAILNNEISAAQNGGTSIASPNHSANVAADPVSAPISADAVADAAVECESANKTATMSCNTMSLIGMPAEASMAAQAGLAMLPGLISQMTSSSNPAKQCSAQANINKAMAAISAAKNAACMFTQHKCTTICAETVATLEAAGPTVPGARAKARLANKSLLMCQGYKAQAGLMLLQTLGLTANALQAGKCAKESSIANVPFPTPSPLNIPNINTDCSNPTMASNPVCICQKDPNNRMCSGQAPDITAGGPGGTTGGGGINAPDSTDLGELDDGSAVDTTPVVGKTSGPGKDPDGGGGGFNGGGNGAALAGMGGDGSGSALPAPTVITGQGSSGSGNNLIGGGNTSGAGRSTASRDDDDQEKLLRGLIPRGGYANRATAGMSIQAVDGATGPMGPTLWEKVSNQVQVQDVKLPFLNQTGR